MSRLLHLVRHGEAEGAAGRAAGRRWDPPLSAAGREAAGRLAATWPGHSGAAEAPPPHLFTSPLRRARETAEVLAARMGTEVRVDARLAEVDFGEWDGRRWDEIHERDPDRLAAWGRDWLTAGPPGGESFAEMAERVVAFWEELAARLAAEAGGGSEAADGGEARDGRGTAESSEPGAGGEPPPVVLVCHGGPIRALLAHLLDLAPEATWDLTVGTGRVSTVRLEPGGRGTAVALDRSGF